MHSRWKPCLSWEHTASSQHVSRWRIVSNDAGHLKIVAKNDKNWLPFQKLCWSTLTLSTFRTFFAEDSPAILSLGSGQSNETKLVNPQILGMSKDQPIPVVTSFPAPTETPPNTRLKDLDFEAKERPGLRKFLCTRNEPNLWFFGDHL